MIIEIEPQSGAERPNEVRRRLLLSGLAGAAALAMSQNVQAQEKAPGAGPIKAGRGTMLTGNVAVVTDAARGIGRAIAVELAANGADIAAIDIYGFVSTASNAAPATQEDLEETTRQVCGLGRQCTAWLQPGSHLIYTGAARKRSGNSLPPVIPLEKAI